MKCRLTLGIACCVVRSGTQLFSMPERGASYVLMGGPSVFQLKQSVAVRPLSHPRCHTVQWWAITRYFCLVRCMKLVVQVELLPCVNSLVFDIQVWASPPLSSTSPARPSTHLILLFFQSWKICDLGSWWDPCHFVCTLTSWCSLVFNEEACGGSDSPGLKLAYFCKH